MRNVTFLSVLALLLSASCTRGPHSSEGTPVQDEPAGPSAMGMEPGGSDPHAGVPMGPGGGPQVGAPGGGATDPHAGVPMGATGPTGEAPAGDPATRPVVGGLAWDIQAPLVARRPSSQMRAAEYGVTGEDPDTQLAVFYFGEGGGGGVQANVDRWVAQFSQPGGGPSTAAAHITTRTVAGMHVTLIDLTGTFGGGMGAATDKPNYRLLGAIAEGPRGALFFKLTGPQAAVTAAEPAFQHLVGSLEVVQGS